MNLEERQISYTTTNSYSTLNSLTDKTKNVWFVCHGMGFLSRYFLRYFTGLNAEENYIIAPQAQSKYYLPPKLKHVGSSWLTKENTLRETENIMNYFDAVFEAENIPKDKNLIVLGYSQGVSVALRYVAKRKLNCEQLVMHSGGIPIELEPENFDFLNAKVSIIYGTEDPYLDEKRMIQEINRGKKLFGKDINIISFEGKHEVNIELIKVLV
ncbi:esterase [Xanthomarina sp. F1114]|uniref:alpha/beta hydrolase n=1 Tax=Xanthomarina sp. F1114 TaxID=2996019 RepID=UPI00225E6973|nr:esterase [Xanthomarina sp. F1114]MCX7547406.1 esterase [Xanthomarina sp. F1114]